MWVFEATAAALTAAAAAHFSPVYLFRFHWKQGASRPLQAIFNWQYICSSSECQAGSHSLSLFLSLFLCCTHSLFLIHSNVLFVCLFLSQTNAILLIHSLLSLFFSFRLLLNHLHILSLSLSLSLSHTHTLTYTLLHSSLCLLQSTKKSKLNIFPSVTTPNSHFATSSPTHFYTHTHTNSHSHSLSLSYTLKPTITAKTRPLYLCYYHHIIINKQTKPKLYTSFIFHNIEKSLWVDFMF